MGAKVWGGYSPEALAAPGVLIAAVEIGAAWQQHLEEMVVDAHRAHHAAWQATA
jgi:hypothetical protein